MKKIWKKIKSIFKNKKTGNKKKFKVKKETLTGKDLAWENKYGEMLTRTQAMETSKSDLNKLGLEKVATSEKQDSYIRSKADNSKKNNLDSEKNSSKK